MRKVVSEAFLRDEISARMSEPSFGSRTFWARPTRCKRQGDGPNWKYSFNAGEVPAGFIQRWENIRAELEAL
jgi:hypothetical protein